MKNMKKINFKDFKPIEGFKVMEWLGPIREKYHELYMKNPEEYNRRLRMIDKRMQERIKKASKNLS
jgi:hypothetical protein